MSSERGDVTFSRLASYSSAMPVSSRLSLSGFSPSSSYGSRGAGYRASSLERAGYSPLSSKFSSRLSGSSSSGSSSRRPPLPTGDSRRRHEPATTRASPARLLGRRDGSTEPSDALTEARRYLQERRERLTRSESREPGGSSLRSLLASEGTGRLLDRIDSNSSTNGTETRRWRTSESQSRERIVPITLERDRAEPTRTVGELRRQFDAARIADAAADESATSSAAAAASTAGKEASDRVVGGRTADSPAVSVVSGATGRQRPAPSSDKEPISPSHRRSALLSDASVSSTAAGSSSRRSRLDSSGETGGGGGGGRSAARPLGLTGLRNIGNTCFMNSVLQCLSNTRALHDYILREEYTADINTTTSAMKGALIKAFGALMCDLWKRSDEPDRVLTTAPFKSQIQRFAPRFMGYQQQDAQEFLRYLLEGLHEDVNRVTSRPKPITTDIDDSLSASQKSMEAWKRFLRLENSKFVDLFVGQLKSTLRCTVCGHASVTFDPFWDLSLPIPSRSGQVRLQACFDLFTKEEVLDGDEKPTCSKCQKRQKCTKSFSIQKFPRILVVHLKRFSPQERFRGKLNTTVDFSVNGLDLSPYSAGQTPCRYNLYGVANHSGTLFSGHYTAYCRHPYTAEWYEYNDSRVHVMNQRNVNSGEAYVLFFELAGSTHV
ncbi:ubiquitin carboxyl-terminal hydrolase 2-like isoform X2 [Amphibalanus amphitrite]|uniref:ubiquitin carboxyl-terminal hydrolase 2-like isoform X2 n=1 Tax=Amphibalanus amphitrite TaxID=1232801 RepID=UPI001C928193|nr:ubiquitin carboxyl-terminal hydrolase 2-like isoform X2 [Amphibalanus amphitrite]XP_043232926.1 ubiquitin carboxyl-terminal hydrolase 2-like isoform X2 [Amphibalanus amphitrite]